MSNEQWEQIYDRLAELVREHRTTLVFVNTRRHGRARRAPPRRAARRGARSPRTTAASRKERGSTPSSASRRGELKALVATASLELGIDIGDVDLVCQLGSPRSIATFLQRVGRSGHAVGGVPKGRLFPLVARRAGRVRGAARRACGAASSTRCAIVPSAARHPGAADRRRGGAPKSGTRTSSSRSCAAPGRTATSTRDDFDAVVAHARRGLRDAPRAARRLPAPRRGQRRRCAARRGARLTAVTSGGAIPDTADYHVVLEPQSADGRHASTRTSRSRAWPATSSSSATPRWRILRVEPGRVRVEDAHGAPPTIPFWLGEAPARTDELSRRGLAAARRRRRAARDEGAHGGDAALAGGEHRPRRRGRARRSSTTSRARTRALGALPTQDDASSLERFFDEAGGMQLVIHAPFGSRLNRAWGLALRKRFCRTLRLRAAGRGDRGRASCSRSATSTASRSTTSFRFLQLGDGARRARRRRCSTRRSSACAGAGTRPARSPCCASPADARSRRSCSACTPTTCSRSSSPTSSPAWRTSSASARSRTIRWSSRRCATAWTRRWTSSGWLDAAAPHRARRGRGDRARPDRASPLAHEILNAQPYAFLDDAPLEERRTQAVLSRALLDPETRGRPRRARRRRHRRRRARRPGPTRATPTSCTTRW